MIHLNDRDIQQYALDKSACTREAIAHVNTCQICRTKANEYELLFSALRGQPKPAFDFDVTELVLSKVMAKKADAVPTRTPIGLFMIMGICSAIGAYWLGEYLTRLVGVPTMVSYLVVTTALVLLLFQAREIIRKYKEQMQAVDFG